MAKLKGGFQKHTEKNADFAKGGDTPMFGQQAADKMKPGTTRDQTSQDDQGQKFAKGGSGKMFGYQGSVAATAGQTGAR